MQSTHETHSIVETNSEPQDIVVSLPVVHSSSLGPPPLIPATSLNTATSLISSLRPITSTLFAPQSAYHDLPLNTQTCVIPTTPLISTTTVSASRYPYDSPFATESHSFRTPVMPVHSTTPSHEPQMFATSRLPKLTLPTFSGDPLKWQAFWDSCQPQSEWHSEV